MSPARPLEIATADEPHFDFCLWEYAPPAPAEGKLRSINLLWRSFEAEGLGPRAFEVVQAIREGLGDSRSVWGIKKDAAGDVSWEFYFYDYARSQRERSISRLLEIVRPWIPCAVPAGERHPYFMFSIDFGRGQLSLGSPIEEVQMYIGNIGSLVSSGVCYGVTRARAELKNFYFFFDAKKEMENVVGKLTSSAYLDPGIDLKSILLPELIDCQTIVVSNKRDRDGAYFCRINVRQLLFFLRRMGFPEEEVAFVDRNAGRLDHMLYDVGFDFRIEGGALKVVKSAYYGTF